jgi:hypothetical protein
MVDTADEWPWSSYAATVGLADSPKWLRRDWILAAFAPNETGAVAEYQRFVAEGANQPSPWDKLKHLVFLGSQAFAEKMQRIFPPDRDLTGIPRAQRRAPGQPASRACERICDAR